ncbi:hypothetical protein [Epilithonimonas zeae]|uniref:hypothetical protein n=1 Tax=Epilithonimonas zeae TaxID=1416779 RepID=UPI00200ECBC3|nr:hypothetical protein [Epilithonimonas zeae]UQB67946.1 hypothetical protein KI430_13020 [Epilithonimonas zeae]
MLITTTLLLGGLSVEARKQSFLVSYGEDLAQQNIEYLYDSNDSIQNLYFLDDHEKSIRIKILDELQNMNVDTQIKINAINLIKELPSLFIENFNPEDFFETSYGTLILDFIKEDSNFNIEIGQNSFGYFSEINGKINHLQENKNIAFTKNFGKLNIDFLDFYDK